MRPPPLLLDPPLFASPRKKYQNQLKKTCFASSVVSYHHILSLLVSFRWNLHRWACWPCGFWSYSFEHSVTVLSICAGLKLVNDQSIDLHSLTTALKPRCSNFKWGHDNWRLFLGTKGKGRKSDQVYKLSFSVCTHDFCSHLSLFTV